MRPFWARFRGDEDVYIYIYMYMPTEEKVRKVIGQVQCFAICWAPWNTVLLLLSECFAPLVSQRIHLVKTGGILEAIGEM